MNYLKKIMPSTRLAQLSIMISISFALHIIIFTAAKYHATSVLTKPRSEVLMINIIPLSSQKNKTSVNDNIQSNSVPTRKKSNITTSEIVVSAPKSVPDSIVKKKLESITKIEVKPVQKPLLESRESNIQLSPIEKIEHAKKAGKTEIKKEVKKEIKSSNKNKNTYQDNELIKLQNKDKFNLKSEFTSQSNKIDLPSPVLIGTLNKCYPKISRMRGEEGIATLSFQVDAKGNTNNIKVTNSTGFQKLDDCAISAIAQAKYKPATKNSLPIKINLSQISIKFKLNSP